MDGRGLAHGAGISRQLVEGNYEIKSALYGLVGVLSFVLVACQTTPANIAGAGNDAITAVRPGTCVLVRASRLRCQMAEPWRFFTPLRPKVCI